MTGWPLSMSQMGDSRWRDLLHPHDDLVRRQIARYEGREIKSVGAAIRPLGISVRAGVHTGEIQLRGEDVGGIGVHIAQRASAHAGPGEVVVSSTVKDLVVGSGIDFIDRGEHPLKGVPGVAAVRRLCLTHAECWIATKHWRAAAA